MTPTQINIGFDPISQKQEFIQYVPLFSTLEVILQHEDVLSVLYAENDSNNASTNSDRKKLRSCRDGIALRENDLFSCDKHALQICLYHDDFNIVNPLGNKTQKYKVSAFYFVIGNFSGKYKSRFQDIQLAILSPASLVSKYGYKEILKPLLLKLEILGIKVSFQGVDHTFFSSISMVVADNLAAHALGVLFVTFQPSRNFAGFVIAVKMSYVKIYLLTILF